MKVITTHLNADFDGLASMIAAQKLYPDALMSFPGSQERNVRRFVADSLHKYTFTKLKQINLDEVDTLIVVDTRQKIRIGDFARCLENPGITIHLYDHHPDTEDDIQGESESIDLVGSTTTLFCRLFQQKKIAISPQEATIFGLGIYEDTGSLTHLTTTPEDLQNAAWLLQNGAQLDIIAQFLSSELTTRQVRLIHELIQNAKTYEISGIKIVVADLTLQKYEDEFSLIVRRVMVLENLNCIFTLVCMEGRIYLIARSRIVEVNTGNIARDFGGGGHASAASATIHNMSMIEAQEKLIRSLHRHIQSQPIAKEMLSRPVISIPGVTTISQANILLTRYNITVLPVVEEGDDSQATIRGTISRRITEKAIHHNLGDAPVSEYMTSDIKTLSLDAGLANIEELIVEQRQRLIPILDEGTLTGVITRTDLLSRLMDDPGHLPRDLNQERDHPSRQRNKDVLQLMGELLDKKFIILLRIIGEVAEYSNYSAYAVGGFVRDLLLGQKNLDLDIVVEGDGIIFAKKLVAKLGGRMKAHDRFKTANIILPDGFKIDVATARLEYYEYPAALPTVELSSIKLDLYRRDFSINAMALQLNPERFGMLIDFFNSQNDLKDRLIRVLHNLSFVEDPSRILRAIRFEKRIGFTIGKHTERLIRGAVKAGFFSKKTNRRIFAELQQIFTEDTPGPAIERMADFRLFQFLWPDLKPNLKIDRRFRHILTQTRRVISWFRLLYLEENAELTPWRIYLLSIMARSKVNQIESFCKRFQIGNAICQDLINEKLAVDELIHRWHSHPPEKNSNICKNLRPLSNDGLLYLMAIARKNEIKKGVSLYVTLLRNMQPLLNGDDLTALGYHPGKIYKEMLAALRDAKLDGLISTREEEKKFIRKKYTQ